MPQSLKGVCSGKIGEHADNATTPKMASNDKTDAVLEPLLTIIKAMQAMEKRVSTAKVSKKDLTDSPISCKIISVSESGPKNP